MRVMRVERTTRNNREGSAAMMFLRSLLFLSLASRCLSMNCGAQKAQYATCNINSETGIQGRVEFAQAPSSCFGARDPLEMLVTISGLRTENANDLYALTVKEYGDISNGCLSTGRIFGVRGDRSPTGFLATYDTASRQAIKAVSSATLDGQRSIVGHTLVISRGPSNKVLGCCVIGISDGSRFAGMPKSQPVQHAPFGFGSTPSEPVKSNSFFGTRHPFHTQSARSLPFSSHDDPKAAHPSFGFDISSLGNIHSGPPSLGNIHSGPPSLGNIHSQPFGHGQFGGGFGTSIAGPSGLSPSISNLKKPPSPPAFPGRIHDTDTGSPLFGPIGEDANSVKNTFGFDLHDFTSLSDSEKFIPRDGEETEGPEADRVEPGRDQGYDGRDPNNGNHGDGRERQSDSQSYAPGRSHDREEEPRVAIPQGDGPHESQRDAGSYASSGRGQEEEYAHVPVSTQDGESQPRSSDTITNNSPANIHVPHPSIHQATDQPTVATFVKATPTSRQLNNASPSYKDQANSNVVHEPTHLQKTPVHQQATDNAGPVYSAVAKAADLKSDNVDPTPVSKTTDVFQSPSESAPSNGPVAPDLTPLPHPTIQSPKAPVTTVNSDGTAPLKSTGYLDPAGNSQPQIGSNEGSYSPVPNGQQSNDYSPEGYVQRGHVDASPAPTESDASNTVPQPLATAQPNAFASKPDVHSQHPSSFGPQEGNAYDASHHGISGAEVTNGAYTHVEPSYGAASHAGVPDDIYDVPTSQPYTR